MTRTAPVASPVDFVSYGDYSVKVPVSADGSFVRPLYPFQGRITADGSSGFPAQAGRYHLYVSLACPWAHRSVIVRELMGLQDVVSLSVVDPIRDGRGWAVRGSSRAATPGGAAVSGGAGAADRAFASAWAVVFDATVIRTR